MHLGAPSSKVRRKGPGIYQVSFFVGFEVKYAKIHVTMVFILLFPFYCAYSNQCISVPFCISVTIGRLLYHKSSN